MAVSEKLGGPNGENLTESWLLVMVPGKVNKDSTVGEEKSQFFPA